MTQRPVIDDEPNLAKLDRAALLACAKDLRARLPTDVPGSAAAQYAGFGAGDGAAAPGTHAMDITATTPIASTVRTCAATSVSPA